MKLYMHTAACSLSPHIVCRELGLDVELIAVDRVSLRTSDGRDYLQINGNGYVPILELADGTRLMEGPAIVQYLADLKPEARLAPPPGSVERAQLQAWLNFISTELHKPLAMQFYPKYAASRDGLRTQVVKRLAWLSERLTGPYLLGEHFSVADAYLFVCLNWTQFLKLDLSPWPNLIDLMRRVAARPAARAALSAEGLVPSDSAGAYFRLPDACDVTPTKRTTAEIMARFNAAFLQHDPTLLDELVGEDCVIENTVPAPDGARYEGRAACLAWWQQVATAPGTGFEVEAVEVFDNRAILRWRFHWGEAAADSVRGVNLMRVQGGLIVEAQGYVKGPA